jgi:ribose/xylose/arabinose/galactoside ABC-type transport system permease subunit
MRECDHIALLLICLALVGAITAAGCGVVPGLFATVLRCADIDATLTAMWSIGEAIASLRNRPRPLCVPSRADRTILPR